MAAARRAHALEVLHRGESRSRGADATSCCDTPKFPNVDTASATAPGDGGGRSGAVLVSPFIKPGTTSDTPYNHFSMLRSVEDLFGLKHLGYAAQPGLVPFGKDVYTRSR